MKESKYVKIMKNNNSRRMVFTVKLPSKKKKKQNHLFCLWFTFIDCFPVFLSLFHLYTTYLLIIVPPEASDCLLCRTGRGHLGFSCVEFILLFSIFAYTLAEMDQGV